MILLYAVLFSKLNALNVCILFADYTYFFEISLVLFFGAILCALFLYVVKKAKKKSLKPVDPWNHFLDLPNCDRLITMPLNDGGDV